MELLEFMENTTKMSGKRSENEKIRRIQEQVHRIKSSEEMGVRYMQEWEEKALEREKGMEEGRLIEKKNTLRNILEDLGEVPVDILKRIDEEKSLDVLQEWIKYAAKTGEIETF